MLDSGANVLVIPWKHGMQGEKAMHTLVRDNKTEGMIVSRLDSHSQVHLIVAVWEAAVLFLISYLVGIFNYQVLWKLHLDKDLFLMLDGWGDQVPATENEDLTHLLACWSWFVSFAKKVVGVDWDRMWWALTGISLRTLSTNWLGPDFERAFFARKSGYNYILGTSCVQELLEHPGVRVVTGDMCRCGKQCDQGSDAKLWRSDAQDNINTPSWKGLYLHQTGSDISFGIRSGYSQYTSTLEMEDVWWMPKIQFILSFLKVCDIPSMTFRWLVQENNSLCLMRTQDQTWVGMRC